MASSGGSTCAAKRGRKKAPTRGRGRPATQDKSLLNQKVIISCALDLAKEVPLQDLSIVRVARELGVTPALIHYYLDGRDALTSGIMSAFYTEMLREWPQPTGRWREDLEAVCRRAYETYIAFPGVAAYVIGHNRFRLVQTMNPGEIDPGVMMFERFVGATRAGGFDAQETTTYAHLLMEFLITMAHSTSRHRWPGEHGLFLDRVLGGLDPALFPNAHFVRKNFVRFDAGEAFESALTLFLNALDVERTKSKRK
ncbi:MAG TPA: TetR/AcrR family transcriptional regulator C-terminal domain-containing protein [Nevskiaceae bacterium]|nr:TetR/AcrR family transcriptional regulator C-terminal domain-containing protein [Nevskiaceae bacterium]